MISEHSAHLSPHDKSFPAVSWGRTGGEFLLTAPTLTDFQTPLLTLERPALSHNTRVMFEWAQQNGLQLAPHGKTTMAPALWRELLDAGAWGLTFATAWQVQCARSFGINRIMLANSLVDPVALTWLVAELAAHAEFEFTCWADSVATVHRMTDALGRIPTDLSASAGATSRRRIGVIVELGGVDGRTGARTRAEALAVADAIRSSDALEVAGVGGYEGALAHDRSAQGIARVDGYLDEIAALHAELSAGGYYGERTPIVTAGGSAYFDRVAERLGALPGGAPGDAAIVVLRSGAFQVHDDGFYRGITPMGMLVGTEPFRAAMHAWVRVVSRPEPGLALFDGGRRDLPFDEGFPEPQRIVGLGAEQSAAILGGSRVTALNDQHGFLRLAADQASMDALPVGTVLRLGLSHPCTALDKWRLIPVIDDADAADPAVVDLVATYF